MHLFDTLYLALRNIIDREEGQDHAEHDGADATEDDGLGLLVRRQRAAGQRDDDGVVAGQDDVDQDDLRKRNPELWTGQEGHGVSSNIENHRSPAWAPIRRG